eukprot:6427139-Pyramimonas_sp.AAC.1
MLEMNLNRLARHCQETRDARLRSDILRQDHGITDGAEALEWIRSVHYEMQKPDEPLGDHVGDAVAPIPAELFDDANRPVTRLLADAGQTADRRARVVVAALREMPSRDA